MRILKYGFVFLSILFFRPGFAQTVKESNNLSSGEPTINLSSSVLILPPGMSGPEMKASEMLLDEVKKRSWANWTIANKLPEIIMELYWVNEMI